MKISELKVKQGKVEVEGKIIDKGDVREFQKFGKSGKVCNAVLKDDSGEIKLTLWNEQIEQVNINDKIKIENGYVGEYQGEKQLTTGKFGRLEVVESSGVSGVTKDEEAKANLLSKKGKESDKGEHVLTDDKKEKTEEEETEDDDEDDDNEDVDEEFIE